MELFYLQKIDFKDKMLAEFYEILQRLFPILLCILNEKEKGTGYRFLVENTTFTGRKKRFGEGF